MKLTRVTFEWLLLTLVIFCTDLLVGVLASQARAAAEPANE